MIGSRCGFAAANRHSSRHTASVLPASAVEDREAVTTSLEARHETTEGATPIVRGCRRDVVVRTIDGWRRAVRQLRIASTEGMDNEWPPLISPAQCTI
jgi:hypothetical protein